MDRSDLAIAASRVVRDTPDIEQDLDLGQGVKQGGEMATRPGHRANEAEASFERRACRR